MQRAYVNAAEKSTWWTVQSVDTMKYSRDMAREKLYDSSFDKVINDQVAQIAKINATHVAIDTPYDEEFIPILKKWVKAARDNNLNVWFRGNFSGWEKWFGYPRIYREEHLKKTKEFLEKYSFLFKNGDIFTPCPECENGGPGDPRQTGDVEGFRKFLIDEYQETTNIFRLRGISVFTNYTSMNGDVASLVMDKTTTKALGGVVVIDHYVATPEKLASDIKDLAEKSGGRIILGEFGVPIPDIHGNLDEKQQAVWIDKAMGLLIEIPQFSGLNYWTNVGSSTRLWSENGAVKLGADSLKKYFDPKSAEGFIVNELGQPIQNAKLILGGLEERAAENGMYKVKYVTDNVTFIVKAEGYTDIKYIPTSEELDTIVMKKTHETLLFKIRKFIHNIFN